jgi:hypothetical protein
VFEEPTDLKRKPGERSREIPIRLRSGQGEGRRFHQSLLRIFTVTLEQLETLNEHRGRTGLSHLGIEHCVV